MSGRDYHRKAARLSQALRGVQTQPNSIDPVTGHKFHFIDWQYEPVWPLTGPSNSATSTFPTSSNSNPKSTLTVPAELIIFRPNSLESLNPSLSNEEIINRISNLLGKGRILLGYKVNQEWLAAQLEMAEGKREVKFVRKQWRPHAGGQSPVWQGVRCYELDVDVEGQGGKGTQGLASSKFRDALGGGGQVSNEKGGGSSSSRSQSERNGASSLRSSQAHAQAQPQAPPSNSNSSSSTKPGLRLFFGPNCHIFPMSLSRIALWNKHLSTGEIKERLAERVKAGHLRRCDIAIWQWDENWLKGEMAKPGWKDRLGWGFDSRPWVNTPMPGLSTEEWLHDLRQKEFLTLGRL